MFWLIFSIVLWGALHSLLASLHIKNYLRRTWGNGFMKFYRFVRHPLYTFSLLILWLSPSMTMNSLIVYSALTVYVFVGILFEERKLLREFGIEFADYKSTTPMLLPGLKWGGNKNFL